MFKPIAPEKGKLTMKNNLQSIQLDIQYVTDGQGNQIFVQIPFAQWQMIYLKLIEEEDQIEEITESPELVDKQGVLVVRAKPLRKLMNITRHERNRRVSELLQRVTV